jgi:hypothetical protein
MKEMYFMLGLAGWIFLGLVAPLMIGAWAVRWFRRRAEALARGFEVPLTEERPAGGSDNVTGNTGVSRRIETSDEKQP